MMLVVGHVYESEIGRRGLCVQCKSNRCLIEWIAWGTEERTAAIYDRNGNPKSRIDPPQIARQVYPQEG